MHIFAEYNDNPVASRCEEVPRTYCRVSTGSFLAWFFFFFASLPVCGLAAILLVERGAILPVSPFLRFFFSGFAVQLRARTGLVCFGGLSLNHSAIHIGDGDKTSVPSI